MRLLIDTNIFLDIFFCRESLKDSSEEFFRKTKINSDEIYVSVATFKDISYFMKKIYHSDDVVNNKLIRIYERITKVISTTSDDMINALYEDGDFEDNVLRNSATRTMCDAIITRNIKHFEGKDINCWTPNEYLKYRN